MLNRQKILLELVRLAEGRIDRLLLTKWAFLIRHETESRGGESFYDFVSYHAGPFSFCLYQEAEKLVAHGYLKEFDSSTWELGELPAPSVDVNFRSDLMKFYSRFRSRSADELLDYVDGKYPGFTINCKHPRHAERPVAELAVYTAGYEGKSVDAFLNGLLRSGIKHLIDVRKNPIARRYGFHRSTLMRLCGQLDIKYSHVPELGIASEFRQYLETTADYQSLFRRYESTTLKSEQFAIDSVAEWIRTSPSVLVCMEANPQCCHRARLAEPVGQATGLPIVHLN